jgi:hypothetical protein
VPTPTTTPTVADYLAYWLADVIKPNREDNTHWVLCALRAWVAWLVIPSPSAYPPWGLGLLGLPWPMVPG